MTFLQSVIVGLLSKIAHYFIDLFNKYRQKMAVRAEVKKAQENLKNAKTPEEQEAAAAELIRITTPSE